MDPAILVLSVCTKELTANSERESYTAVSLCTAVEGGGHVMWSWKKATKYASYIHGISCRFLKKSTSDTHYKMDRY